MVLLRMEFVTNDNDHGGGRTRDDLGQQQQQHAMAIITITTWFNYHHPCGFRTSTWNRVYMSWMDVELGGWG
jgi:hypothetical protein